MTVVQTFGMTVNKFGILWSPIRHIGLTSSLIAVVCCRIHNFMLTIKNEPYTIAADPDTNVLGTPQLW